MGAMKDMVEVTVPVRLDGTVTFHMAREEHLAMSAAALNSLAVERTAKVMATFNAVGGFKTGQGTLYATVETMGSAGVYDPTLEN